MKKWHFIFIAILASLFFYFEGPLTIVKYYASIKLQSKYTDTIHINNFEFKLNNLLCYITTPDVTTLLDPNPFTDGIVWIEKIDNNELYSKMKKNEKHNNAKLMSINGSNATYVELYNDKGKHIRQIAFYNNNLVVTYHGKAKDFKCFKETFESVKVAERIASDDTK